MGNTWTASSHSNPSGNCVEVWRKSTHSVGDGACVEFRRSSHCPTNEANCVECGDTGHSVLVRDSKDPEGGILEFSPAAWDGFLTRIKMGDIGEEIDVIEVEELDGEPAPAELPVPAVPAGEPVPA